MCACVCVLCGVCTSERMCARLLSETYICWMPPHWTKEHTQKVCVCVLELYHCHIYFNKPTSQKVVKISVMGIMELDNGQRE